MRKIDLKGHNVNLKAFLSCGFAKEGDAYRLRKRLPSFPFLASYVLKDGCLECLLLEEETNEEYALADLKGGRGYSRQVKEEYDAITEDILFRCAREKKDQKGRLIDEIIARYGELPDHPFAHFPRYICFRRKENRSWYCLFMDVKACKLRMDGERIIDVLNVRGAPSVVASIDHKRIFPGYHMNKKHWLSLVLDDRLSDEEILNLIEESRSLAE